MRAGGDDLVAAALEPGIRVRALGRRDYRPALEAMRAFTNTRAAECLDELWVVEHPPVFTLGLNASIGHVLEAGDVPVIRTDRGGQVTYHGPGQVVIYLLADLHRLGLGVRAVVAALEAAVIAYLGERRIVGERRAGAPGVFVAGRKIAALGLRVRRGCTYHGLSFNVDMDLAPFARIDPCGYKGLEVTQLAEHDPGAQWQSAARGLCRHVGSRLGYNDAHLTHSEFSVSPDVYPVP